MNAENKIERDDEIDLIALLSQLYRARKLIVKITLVFFVVGLLVALVSPKVFKAHAVFVVQDTEKQVSSSLSGLAALAGVNLQSESVGAIPASLYPNIVTGIPFKLELLNTPLKSKNTNYKEYLIDQNNSTLSLLKKYTIGLPGVILKSLNSNKQNDAEIDLKQLDEIEFGLTQSLEELVNVEVNQKEGFITLSALDSDPKIAARIASRALDLLQEQIILFKTNNAKRIFDYVETQYQIKQKQYDSIQIELASFKDRNKNISTAVFESNLEKLQTQYDLVYAVYLELAKQREQAKLQVNKEIPNISVIEPIYVPSKKEQPKRALILVIFTFLGVVISCGWILISDPVNQIMKEIKAV